MYKNDNLVYAQDVQKAQTQYQYSSQIGELISQLSQRAALDLAAATSAAFLVCPFMMMVDKSVTENASGKRTLTESLLKSAYEFTRKPWNFYRRPELWMIFGVYSATYFAANFLDSIGDVKKEEQKTAKFLGVTTVNMSASIAKDQAYAQMFGTSVPRALPMTSFGCFVVRDSLTIAAAFTIPKKIANNLHEQYGWSYGTCHTIAQLLCPVAVQVVTTPWHLLALDCYNRQGVSPVERMRLIRGEVVKSTLARMGRIFPAFGVGGVSNKYFRDSLKGKFIQNKFA
eukprot:TRINITY_DN14538_c0_g1_i10.p3 TRINITY_DN14538_c0_g1~~TRINITY_DN14538_c0_g1_i10.p3  ORF type:complete len:285 (+),score=25.38 TRINITY_DN14538_c0_g1_i10:637-1491(+)